MLVTGGAGFIGSNFVLADTFETGLRRTVRWYLDHRDWVEDVTWGAHRQWIGANCASSKG